MDANRAVEYEKVLDLLVGTCPIRTDSLGRPDLYVLCQKGFWNVLRVFAEASPQVQRDLIHVTPPHADTALHHLARAPHSILARFAASLNLTKDMGDSQVSKSDSP